MKINISKGTTYQVKVEEKIPDCDFEFQVEFINVLDAMQIREDNSISLANSDGKSISSVNITPFTKDVISLLSKRIKSWNNVNDTEGKPIPCTPENIKDLLIFLLSCESLSYKDDEGKLTTIPFLIFEAARKAENFQTGDLKNLNPSSKH